ncbi:MAG: DUF3524 domain-containing protein [Phycisphaerae bacterium]|nr:DUF3524 domain-containing protein [Phycisphaerae bacterium]
MVINSTGKPPYVLAFEAWDSGSHRAVREAICRHAEMNWHWIVLGAANWRWRLRLSAPSLVSEAKKAGVLAGEWDLVFATSLVPLADLVSLLPPRLAALPRVLYMHENQAEYPASTGEKDHRDVHAVATNIMSMLAADRVLWNSNWNRDSFLAHAETIVRAAKGAVDRSILDQIEDRSEVVWPPVEIPVASDPGVLHKASEAKSRGLTLVAWPHRWEHDKGPEELLAIDAERGERDQLGWVLLGEQFNTIPEAFPALQQQAGERIIHAGRAPRAQYESWLHACDWVLSTARHEFFGVGVVEAMLAGCLPWLPDRLSYPELVPPECMGLSPANPPANIAATQDAIRLHLAQAIAPQAVQKLEKAIEMHLPHARR